MDLSKHAILASRFATLALVFSVSACVLSQSMTEEQQVASKRAESEKAPGNHPKVVSESSSTNAGSGAAAAPAIKSTPGKPGSLKAANQQVSKIASSGKLDQVRPKPAAEQRRPAAVKVVRYVNVDILNVREHTSMEAPVVGKLIRGSMFQVSISGDWARIGDSQFVMTKFLTTKPGKRGTNTWTYQK